MRDAGERGRMRGYALFALVLGALTGCGLPHDPDGSLERVSGGTLRAGLVLDPPWTTFEEGRPAGVEVRLLEEFAAKLGATVEWKVGAPDQLMPALERRELDVVVGGLTDDNPYLKKLGVSRPYLTSELRVGVPPGIFATQLEGMEVAAERGTEAPELVREKGARVRALDDVARYPGARAAPDWRLEQWDYQPIGEPLAEKKRVMAVQPGENAFLVALDKFLHASGPRVPELLRAQETRR